MFKDPKIPTGYMSLADWKGGNKLESEKTPLLSDKPTLEKNSINQIVARDVIIEMPVSPLISRHKEFDFTKIKDTLETTSITRNEIMKGIALGVLFSIPFSPVAYSLGVKGTGIIAGIISLVAAAYCYIVHKNIKFSDDSILPVQPATSTPVMNISNSIKNQSLADHKIGVFTP